MLTFAESGSSVLHEIPYFKKNGQGRSRWSYSVMVITLDFESSNPGSNPGRTFFSFFHTFIFMTHSKPKFSQTYHKKVQWPSGLRRSTQVRVSSEAWVRIPSEPFLSFWSTGQKKNYYTRWSEDHRWNQICNFGCKWWPRVYKSSKNSLYITSTKVTTFYRWWTKVLSIKHHFYQNFYYLFKWSNHGFPKYCNMGAMSGFLRGKPTKNAYAKEITLIIWRTLGPRTRD